MPFQKIALFDHALLEEHGISLSDLGYLVSTDDARYSTARRDHPLRSDFFIFSYVSKGSLRLRMNLIDYQITAGQLFLVLPQTVFEILHASPDLLVQQLLAKREFITGSGILGSAYDVTELYAGIKRVMSLDPAEGEVFRSLIGVMNYQTLQQDSKELRADIARHAVVAILYELLAHRRRRQPDSRPASRKEELTTRFIQLAMANFREERSVQFYADKLFVTAKYLSTAVKEVLGKAPGAIIDDAVISEARILLTDPGLSVSDIAARLHFSDQSFFGKFFRKHTGLSPTEYRQERQSG